MKRRNFSSKTYIRESHPGGVVIIDDYGFNVGCAKAVDEYAADKRILFSRFDRWGRSGVKP